MFNYKTSDFSSKPDRVFDFSVIKHTPRIFLIVTYKEAFFKKDPWNFTGNNHLLKFKFFKLSAKDHMFTAKDLLMGVYSIIKQKAFERSISCALICINFQL